MKVTISRSWLAWKVRSRRGLSRVSAKSVAPPKPTTVKKTMTIVVEMT